MSRLLKMYESCNPCKQKFDKHIYKIKFAYTWSVRHNSHYNALGLDSTATAKDIKSAYYKLSLQFHPDKNNGSEESVAKFREISEAYEVLSNAEKKMIYDQDLRFRPQYSTNYGQSEKMYRSKYNGPYTGKTKDFNHEEHFRQHYQNAQKQREMELEYFRRRWDAEFYRRYPTAEEYYRNRHTHEENYEDLSKRFSRKRGYSLYVLFGFWCLLFFCQGLSEFINNPDKRIKHGPLYYKVHSKDEELKDKDKQVSVNQN